MGCRSGGDDDNKGNGMKPGETMAITDAEAVKRAKENALRIDYAEGDSAEQRDTRCEATRDSRKRELPFPGNLAIEQ